MARSLDVEPLPRSFGPFTLLRRIAAGGMAEVFVATVVGPGGLEKLLAIKLIHERHSEDDDFVRMLIDEAKLSVLLSHPNIAQSFDLGCVDGRYFLLMEYVEGADASRLLARARSKKCALPIATCLHIVRGVLDALDYAHTKHGPDGLPLRLIHRDVSPQNVLLGMAGEVKLADFGIAKAASRSEQTAVGVIKGKYGYMSPEQAWGDPLDARSDVFAAGLLLRELLTGQTLYDDEDDLPQLLDKVRKARIPPASIARPEVSREIDAVIAKAVARDVNARFASANDFARDLDRLLASLDPAGGASRVAQVMTEHFGPGATSDRPPVRESVRPTRHERLPKMNSGDFVPEDHSVLFSLRRSTLPPPPLGRTERRARLAGEDTAVARPLRDSGEVLAEADGEDEATTFFHRDDAGVAIDGAVEDATVIDSELALASHDGVSGRLPKIDVPPLMRDVRGVSEYAPPAVNWKPLPFVGPSFEVAPLVPLSRDGRPRSAVPRWALVAGAAALGLVGLSIALLAR